MTALRISPDLALPVDAATGTFGILATKGAGKSNAAVVMAEEMWDAGIPWVAVDPKGDWWGIRSSSDGKGAGLPIIVFGGRHGDIPLEPTAGALIADLVLQRRITCVLDVSQFSKADTTRFLLAFGRHLFTHADDDGPEPLHLFLEEAHEYLPQQVKGDQAELVNVWQRIVKQGRFKGLGCTMVSQRSSVLNKDVLELIDTLIVLRTIGPLSRKAIDAWVRDQDVDGSLLASLPSLASGEAWVWSPGELGLSKRIRFRRRRTFDSGYTPKVGQARKSPTTIADVDLAAIKEQMADTIERAQADDPKVLRRRIAQLEKELAQRPTETRVETVVERVEVPVFDEALVVRLEQALQPAESVLDQIGATLAVHNTWLREEGRRDRQDVPRARPSGRRVGAGNVGEGKPAQRADPPARREPGRASVPRAAPTEGDLPKGEHRILTAVAQYPDGVTREQLSVLTGYKRSSRDTYLQRLRERDLIVVAGAKIEATWAGVDALGPDFEPLPTGAALQEHWLDVLPEGERRILVELIKSWPRGVHREDLSEETGYKRSSRDTYLQRLRARQLVTTDGDPRAADVLFEEVRK